MLDKVLAYLIDRNILGMLRRDNNGMHTDGAVALILDSYLSLSVGAKIAERSVLTNGCEALRKRMRELNRHRHKLRCLVAREAEHHTLVARTGIIAVLICPSLSLKRTVNTERDIGRLLVNGVENGTGIAVKTVCGIIVAYLANGLAYYGLKINKKPRRLSHP